MVYRPLIFLILLFGINSSSFSMEPGKKKPKQVYKIQTADEKIVEVNQDFIDSSTTLTNFVKEFTDPESGKFMQESIPLPNISKKELKIIIELFKAWGQFDLNRSRPSLEIMLEELDVEPFCKVINDINYLDIEKLLNPATDVAASRLSGEYTLGLFARRKKTYC
jgi:hypothetical protein